MSEASAPAAAGRLAWHFWVVVALALIWNGYGAYQYVAINADGAGVWPGTTPDMAAALEMPVWYTAVWAIAVWSALLAALCLALRRAWAVWLFALSLLGLVVNMVYAFAFAGADAAPGEIMFTVILILIGLFELIYAQAMQKRGVLR